MEILDEYGVVFPKGFKGAGVHAGLKKRKKDLAMIYSELPCTLSGVFTQNVVKAAPVVITEKVAKAGVARVSSSIAAMPTPVPESKE